MVVATAIVALRLILALMKVPAEEHAVLLAGAGEGEEQGAVAEAMEANEPAEVVELEAEEEQATAEQEEAEKPEPSPEKMGEVEEEELGAAAEDVGTEEYHFRRTRWGMGLDVVKTQEVGVLIRQGEERLTYLTTTLELPCLLTYGFSGGGLVRARLAFHDLTGGNLPPMLEAQARKRYRFLRRELIRRYGESEEREVHQPRETAHLEMSLRKHVEDIEDFEGSLREAAERLQRERTRLEEKYRGWKNQAEAVSNGVAKYERDLRDYAEWKRDAEEKTAAVRAELAQVKALEMSRPLTVLREARWAAARGLHRVELRMDLRRRDPQLEIRYESLEAAETPDDYDEL